MRRASLQRWPNKRFQWTRPPCGGAPLNHVRVGQGCFSVCSLEKVLAQVFVAEQYGRGRWRKVKGIAKVRLPRGTIRLAETHWYEAHGIGKKEFKLKMPFLD